MRTLWKALYYFNTYFAYGQRSKYSFYGTRTPVPVAARSKGKVCSRSLAEIVGSNPTGGMDVCLL